MLTYQNQRIQLWATASDTIEVTIAAADEVTFKGRHREIQTYLKNQENYAFQLYKEYQERDFLLHYLSQQASDQYFEITDLMTRDRIKFLHKSIDTTRCSNNVRQFVTDHTDQLIFHNLEAKIKNTGLQKFRFYAEKENIPGNYFYGFTDKNPFNDTAHLRSAPFLEFANLFFMHVAAKHYKESNVVNRRDVYVREALRAIDRYCSDSLANGVHKLYFLNDELETQLSPEDKDLRQEIYTIHLQRIKAYKPLKEKVEILEKKFHEADQHLYTLTANPAPDFYLEDISNNPVNLKTEKGKLLYITVWASWCGPCIGKIPMWNKLYDQYKDNPNVKFIMISIDSDESAWQKAMDKFTPQGTQLISPDSGAGSDFARKLGITGVPAYILIGKDGHILDVKAHGPSVIKLADYIEK
jgi:thiol-disulfide isomerase/thioredoxin